MSEIQQEVIIYKDSAFTTAQRSFEKDLRKRQHNAWRLVSVTPTKTTFGRTRQLTAIYEKNIIPVSNLPPSDQYPEKDVDEEPTREENSTKQDGVWSKVKRANQRAIAKEQAYQSTLDPEQLRKRKRRNTILSVSVIIIVLLLCTGTVVGAALTNGASSQSTTDSSSTPTQATTPTAKSSPAATPTPKPTVKPTPTPIPYAQFNDGTYVVGKDIQPGTYRTRQASPNCYYARLSGFGGTVDDIIANNNTDYPAIVTILSTDKGFESDNCGTWTKNLSAITTSKTSFGDGMFIVGTDILPGTYKSSGQSGCYYARLSGFGNSTDDIIANNNTDTPAIITIYANDKGFQSNNCGTWTKE